MAIEYITGTVIADYAPWAPPGIVAGDRLVLMLLGEGIPATPSGWTSLATGTEPTYGYGVRLVTRAATGPSGPLPTTGYMLGHLGVWRGATITAGALRFGGIPALTGLGSGTWVGALGVGFNGPSAIPAGMVRRPRVASEDGIVWEDVPAADQYMAADTNGPVSSWSQTTNAATSIGAAVRLTPSSQVHPVGQLTWGLGAGLLPGPTARIARTQLGLHGIGIGVQIGTEPSEPGAIRTGIGTRVAIGTSVVRRVPIDTGLGIGVQIGTTALYPMGPLVWGLGAGLIHVEATIPQGIILHRPPRTLAELLRDGTRRRDHILITTGEHAGEELPTSAWSLTLDHLATIRATGSATVQHTEDLAQLLDPRARTELAMIIAIEDDLGVIHTWQKALLHTVPLSRAHGMQIELEDRAAWVRAAGMRSRLVMPAGMDIAQAIITLLGARASWLPVDIPASGAMLPADAVLGGLGADPWQIAGELARAIGRRLYIDPYGAARTTPITDILTADIAAVWSDHSASVVDLETTISDADVINVIGLPWQSQPAEGAAPDAIIAGTAWWEDTTSSVGTHILGDRVATWPGDTSLITSPAQAQEAAIAHGLTVQGIAIQVAIPGVRMDPYLDVGDVVRLQDEQLGLDMITRLTGITYAAGESTMGVTLADRRML